MPHVHEHHAHPHGPGVRLGPALALGVALNVVFVVIEAAYGFIGNSMALLADAGHNLGDVLGLAAAVAASLLTRRRPSHRYTYGLRSSSILAALLNAIVLLIAVGGIVVEAAQRLANPQPVAEATVIVVAGIGILVNGATALLLRRGRSDLNIRSAYAHMAGDALVSLGVAVSGAIVLATGWLWLDPAVSIAVALAIVVGTWQLLRRSLDMALHAVPADIDPQAVRDHLRQLAGVAGVHDLHIWPMSTTETALTCHLVMPAGHPGDDVLARLAHDLDADFAIQHVTIQVERGDPDHPCALVPEHVV